MDSPGCRRQGPAGLGACRARLPSPSLCAVIQLPYLSCLHRPHPHPHPRGPHPNSNQNQRPCLLWACPPPPAPQGVPCPQARRKFLLVWSPASPRGQAQEPRSCHLTPALSWPSHPQGRGLSNPLGAASLAGVIPGRSCGVGVGGGGASIYSVPKRTRCGRNARNPGSQGRRKNAASSQWLLPSCFLGTAEGPEASLGAWSVHPAQRPGNGRTRGSQSTLPVTGTESKWISGASVSFSGATLGTPRPALVSSSSSLSSN